MTSNKITKFIIICHGRTGSNYLRSLLNSHNDIYCFDELFNPKGEEQEDFQKRLENPTENINKKVFENTNDKKHIKGFKLLYYQLPQSPEFEDNLYNKNNYVSSKIKKTLYEYLEYLKNQTDIKIIHLKRKNMLKTLISLKKAGETNVWTSKTGQISSPKITLNKFGCEHFFKNTRNFETKYDQIFKNHDVLQITYEELYTNRVKTIDKVLDFLGAPKITLHSPLRKINSDNVSDLVENIEELKEHFANSPHIEFFN